MRCMPAPSLPATAPTASRGTRNGASAFFTSPTRTGTSSASLGRCAEHLAPFVRATPSIPNTAGGKRARQCPAPTDRNTFCNPRLLAGGELLQERVPQLLLAVHASETP